MPSIICYADPSKKYSRQLCLAFAKGAGGTVDLSKRNRGGPALIHGMGHWQKALMQKIPKWWEVDHAYVGRGEYHRITADKLWIDGTGDPDFERFARLKIRAHPRAEPGTNILLVAQSPEFYDIWVGEREIQWANRITAEIRKYTDREIIFRRKPIRGQKEPPLQQHLDDTWCVVTQSSGVALDGYRQGIPAVVLDNSYPAARLATPMAEIESPRLPKTDEVEHLHAVLAANQWTIAEMQSGEAWRALQSGSEMKSSPPGKPVKQEGAAGY